tara:strand:- start:1492 stop:1764 length:273 start_codon:yes stop_codon:yes gene_type:complete
MLKSSSPSAPEDHCRVTQEDAGIIAEHLVDRLVARLTDENTVQAIASVWGKQLDQHIGRTVRRGVYTVLVGLVIFLGIKMDAIVAWLRSP